MSRPNDRKLNLTVESLEGRKLQSGLLSNTHAAITPMVNNPAVITTAARQSPLSNYHTVTGFFGQ